MKDEDLWIPKDNEELLQMLKKQYAAFTGPEGERYRTALGVTDEDITRIKHDLGEVEKIVTPGYSQSDLDELATDTESCRRTALEEVAVQEAQIRDSEIRALLFEEILLRCLDENTALPLSMLPSATLTKVADYNMASVKDLPRIIEKFGHMSDRELIAAARAEVIHIRKNIGKDPYATEDFASRLSGQTDELEKIARQQAKPNDNINTDGGMGM